MKVPAPTGNGDAWLGELHSQNHLLVGDMIPSPQALYVLLRVSSIVGTASLTPLWVFSKCQRLKMRASTLCINPTRFGSFVTYQHWPCSTTRIACIEQLFEAFKTEPSTIHCWSCALGFNFTWNEQQVGTISDFDSDVSQPSKLTPTCHFIPVV